MAEKLRVCLLGFDSRSSYTLNLYLSLRCATQCVLVDDEEADVWLIDMDVSSARKEYVNACSKAPNRPRILLSHNNLKLTEGDYALTKPLKAKDMLDVFALLSQDKDLPTRPAVVKEQEDLVLSKVKLGDAVLPTEKEKSEVFDLIDVEENFNGRQLTEIKQLGDEGLAEPFEYEEARVTTGHEGQGESEATEIIEGVVAPKTTPEPEMSINLLPPETIEAEIATAAARPLQYIPALQPDTQVYLEPQQMEVKTFQPQQHFFGKLQEACSESKRNKQVLQLLGGQTPVIIFPATNRVYLGFDDVYLKSLCSTKLVEQNNNSEFHTEKLALQDVYDTVNSEHCPDPDLYQDLDAFLWKVAIWTANGRVPESLASDAPVYLQSWPNLSRFILPPKTMRIIAFWIGSPRTLTDLAQVCGSGVTLADVCTIYTATEAVGLAGGSRRQVDGLVEADVPKESKNKGLLSRLLARLSD